MFNVQYVAGNGNEYVFLVDGRVIPTTCFVCDRRVTENACRKACLNFGKAGGCPPRAPHFVELAKVYTYAYVVYVLFSTDQVPQKLLSIPQWAFVSMTFQDALLSRFMNYVGNTMKAQSNTDVFKKYTFTPCDGCTGGYCTLHHRVCGGGVMLLGQGHCMGCQSCAFKKGAKRCVHPDRRVFSLEATGVLVDSLMLSEFGRKTYWWSFQSEKPPYMMKTIALLLPTQVTTGDMAPILLGSLKGHKSVKEVRCDE